MSPFGKIVTTMIALVTGTSLLTGVTTAYMLRPAGPTDTMTATYATPPVRRVPAAVAPRVAPTASRATVDTNVASPVATTASVGCSEPASARPAAPSPMAAQARARVP